MLRSLALSSTALAAVFAHTAPAHATCNLVVNVLTCTADETTGLDEDTDGLTIEIQSGVTITNPGDDTIRLRGEDMTVTIDGTVGSLDDSVDDDRAIRPDEDGFAINVSETGAILSSDSSAIRGDAEGSVDNQGMIAAFGDTIRLDEGNIIIVNGASDNTAAKIIASGLEVEDDEDDEFPEDKIVVGKKGIRVRGEDTVITNYGTIEATGEAVEGRDGFMLTNYGRIEVVKSPEEDDLAEENTAAVGLEDGVQFGDGTLMNMEGAVIIGRDDGVDVDSGKIVNKGLIKSTDTGDGAAIDVDEIGEDGEAAPTLEIENEGTLEGVIAILYDSASTAEQKITNGGTIRGTGGTAIQFAPGQGASQLTLLGGSQIFGDVNFGNDDDTLTIADLTSDVLIASTFNGGGGDDTADLTAYLFSETTNFVRTGIDSLTFDLLAGNGNRLTADFTGFEFFDFGDGSFEFNDIAPPFTAPIPLPPSLPLMAAGLAGLAILRRRR